MKCPLDRMAQDAKIDASIFSDFMDDDPQRCGERMWYLATCGMDYDTSMRALGRDWCRYLEQKYPNEFMQPRYRDGRPSGKNG